MTEYGWGHSGDIRRCQSTTATQQKRFRTRNKLQPSPLQGPPRGVCLDERRRRHLLSSIGLWIRDPLSYVLKRPIEELIHRHVLNLIDGNQSSHELSLASRAKSSVCSFGRDRLPRRLPGRQSTGHPLPRHHAGPTPMIPRAKSATDPQSVQRKVPKVRMMSAPENRAPSRYYQSRCYLCSAP